MSHLRPGLAASLFLLLAASAHAAVSIQYTLVPLGGNAYRYVYTINNSTGSTPAQLFDILFDTTLYSEASLQIVTPSSLHADWSEQLLGSLPGLPANYDVLSLHGGIPGGGSVAGFSVEFKWLGSGTPGAQPFKVYDGGSFQLLQNGVTTGVVSVPAASPLSLLALALGMTFIAYVQRLAHGHFAGISLASLNRRHRDN